MLNKNASQELKPKQAQANPSEDESNQPYCIRANF